jgi:hypothetical protein
VLDDIDVLMPVFWTVVPKCAHDDVERFQVLLRYLENVSLQIRHLRGEALWRTHDRRAVKPPANSLAEDRPIPACCSAGRRRWP